ncbi:UDP-3-O-(3-hydroxymyristoyl)glucosamine N-acyltransferase [Methylovorus sp. MM2]|uniref:UDP-3-O-(3-hydroxymyristoyl)glucosamine N-acyltransferase n=1 Tax=Methylovorus sp. MM2 TaxID=1848038 RepID=UPI0007E288A5|nr:UDP-3-O-(3-hydroxymyristoyl)glucosamine N-acyltransferase [Methylovorus sp. MM2]OAM52986.1 UDP-3-O-(3-hydroxymyristoyl)glucosamine N-acyltransferase [Methylovorus sp. MM2]
MTLHYSLQEIVSRFGGELIDGNAVSISRVASLANAEEGQISFLTDSKYRALLATTRASAVILSHDNSGITNLPRIVTDNPYAYFAKVSELLNPAVSYQAGIDPSANIAASSKIPETCTVLANAVISAGVTLGDHIVIGAGCIIGEGVHIGSGTILQANVVVYRNCVIGRHCIIAAGVVIGADGFGYANDQGQWVKIPQVGRVIIEDHVDIGSNTSIDRGALDDTVIETGVKLDNLIQIGHNCRIGAHTVIAGCVGVAGSARIGKRCRIGGAAMILGHLDVADDVTISPGSMITRSLTKADTYTALMPFQAHDDWLKTAANIRRLGDISERVKELERELEKLKLKANQTDKN